MNPDTLMEQLEIEYQSILRKGTSLCFISCMSKLQAECGEEIIEFIEKVGKYKATFVENDRCDLAKYALVVEIQMKAIFNELGCLVNLKESQAAQAWDCLVLSQEAVKVVGRLHGNAERQFKRLRMLECMLFPPQSFMSAGIIVKKALCSICKTDYLECEHVINEVYRGELCLRIFTEGDLLEVSFLGDEKQPRDRRCRVTHLEKDGVKTDLLTGETVVTGTTKTALFGQPLRFH